MGQIGDANSRGINIALKHAAFLPDHVHGDTAKNKLSGYIFDAWPVWHVAHHAIVRIGDDFEYPAFVIGKGEIKQITFELK